MPSVSRISIAPVRGLGLEHPTSVELGPTGVLEDRRFFLADAGGFAHQEDRWIGREIGLGTARLSITHPDARCAITTHDPDSGDPDLDTLRTIIAYRGLRDDKKIDFGVLGEVVAPGRVSVGDEVAVLD